MTEQLPMTRGIWYNRASGRKVSVASVSYDSLWRHGEGRWNVAYVNLHPNTLEEMGGRHVVSKHHFLAYYCRREDL